MIRRDKIYFLVCVSIVAAIIDFKQHRIPNWLVLALGVTGIILLIRQGNLFCIYQCIIDCFLAGVIMYPLYLVGAMGAGDVKLYALLPIYSSRRHILQLYLLVFCVGAVLGLVKLLFTSDGRCRITHFVDNLKSCISLQCNTTEQVLPIQKLRIPMAIPFALGILIAMVLEVSNIYYFFEV